MARTPGISQGYTQYVSPLIVARFDNASASGPIGSGPDLLSLLSKFSFHTSDMKAGELTLEFSDPFGALADDSRLATDANIRFRFGYANRMSKEFVVVIKEVRPIFPDTGEVTIQVKAFDLSVVAKDNCTTVKYGLMKSSDIVTQIGKRLGYQLDVKDSIVIPTKERVQDGKTSDMDYMKSLADELNWDLFVDGNRLVFRPKNFEGSPSYVLSYKTINVNQLRKFAPTVQAYKATTVASAGLDDRTGNANGNKTDDSGEKKAGVTVVTVNGNSKVSGFTIKKSIVNPQAFENQAAGFADKIFGGGNVNAGVNGGIKPTVETNPQAQEVLDNAALARKEEKKHDATLDMLGTPDIFIRDLVRLTNVSRKWSGIYRVAEVKQEISSLGYSTTLSLRKNALGAGGGNAVPKQDQTQNEGQSATSTIKVMVVNGDTKKSTVEYRPQKQ